MKDANKNSLSSQSFELALSYYKSGQPSAAEEICRKVLLDDPKNAQSLHLLGTVAAGSGRYDEAVELFSQVTKLDKKNPYFFHDLGFVLQKRGKLDEALLKYKKAVSLKPDYIKAHIGIGNILKEQGKLDEAELKYQRIIALKPDHAEAYNNLGIIFGGQKKFEAAAEMYSRAISLKPDFAVARYNLGYLLNEQGKPDEAIAQYAEALAIKPDFVDAHIDLGNVFKKRGLLNEAVSLYERASALQPDNPEYLAELVHASHQACMWGKIGSHKTRLLEMVRQKRAGIHPFKILGTPATAEDQLTCARSFNAGEEHLKRVLFTHNSKKPADRIKIGYLSSDFFAHATAHLIAELFERHDRSRFIITAYSHGPDDNSDIRKRLVKAFDEFIDVRDLSDHAAAQKIYADGTNILIDLNGGFTKWGRMGIPAYRPAPVQVNYLGFPGTMGASFIDYIIADRFIIPEDQEKFYSEKVVCLPDCYQPNDTQRKIEEATPTRGACGLPERKFVFCCFNGNFKITPQIFDIWMRLLQKVSGSVLWLLETNLSIKGNLKKEAGSRGVDPTRIIFAPRMPIAEHLARHRLADLFLDTLPYNAHTTTSDALWAGLPLLTCAGTTFAGRVAGSLLKAADLPELITYSLEDYEALALQLAQNPAQLSAIRERISRTRLQMPLFDIQKFTKNIEKSYQTMWDICQAGDSPKAFSI